MKIALAQIDMRLGDIEGICARIESQAILAKGQGADVVCTPAPLFSGVMPGSLIEAENYEHDLISALTQLARHLDDIGISALVPAVVNYEGASLFEVFVIEGGRVAPSRTALTYRRDRSSEDLWSPPVFDIAGVRVALSFDALGDLPGLPSGCDLMIYFQANAFSVNNEISSAVASIADGHFTQDVARKGVWLACMSPVGAFDDAVYTGGSFIMDDGGRVVAQAPCFEEALLVQEVRRGVQLPCIEPHELPHFQREEWTWEALRLALRDGVHAQGCRCAALVLEGDLQSSLAAALAVDALGPRNVVGLFVEREEVYTPAQEAAEQERAGLVRTLAQNLHIRLVEHAAPDVRALLDRDASRTELMRALEHASGMLLDDLARQEHAVAVSSLTKTEAALVAPSLASRFQGTIAPFGDIYLTELEFLARVRNRAGEAVPIRLVTLNAVERSMETVIARAMADTWEGLDIAPAIAQVLSPLEPSQIDGVLEAHVDRGLSFEDLPLAETHHEAVGLLLMLVRRGETARRMLPSCPSVSGRSFSERAWPRMLAWSDLGRRGEAPLTCGELAREEVARVLSQGEAYGERVRDEIMGLIGGMLGITPEQLDELRTEEGQKRLRQNYERFEGQMREAINHIMESEGASSGGPGQHPQGFPFFSQN